jgi:hypothetical protein
MSGDNYRESVSDHITDEYKKPVNALIEAETFFRISRAAPTPWMPPF